MKRLTCALLMAAAWAQPAWADEDDAPAAAPGWWRPYVGVGYAWGGNTLAPIKIKIIGTETIYDEDISAGAGLDLRLGLRLQPADWPIGIKMAAAYETDGAAGLSGWHSFSRHPIELGLSMSLSERWSVGVGARKSLRAKLRDHKDDYPYQVSDGVTTKTVPGKYDFHSRYSSSMGAYAEVEWHVTSGLSLSARGIHESFRLKSEALDTPYGSASVDYGDNGKRYGANSFSLALTYYFR